MRIVHNLCTPAAFDSGFYLVQGVPRKGGKDWGGLPQFTPDAELINGRVAMLGFAGLVFTEWAIGHAVF